jgi:hypothetical protein
MDYVCYVTRLFIIYKKLNLNKTIKIVNYKMDQAVEIKVNNDLIWIVSASLLYKKYPHLSPNLKQMIETSFGTDDYPGEKHPTYFELSDMYDRSDEFITFLLYIPNCHDSNHLKHVSAFLTLHYVFDEDSITMWNLCSIERGKGYASLLVNHAMKWTEMVYKSPLRLKIYIYNPMFKQVLSFYTRRKFVLEKIERNGAVVCMIQGKHITSYTTILRNCWKFLLKQAPSQERIWLTERLISLAQKI